MIKVGWLLDARPQFEQAARRSDSAVLGALAVLRHARIHAIRADFATGHLHDDGLDAADTLHLAIDGLKRTRSRFDRDRLPVDKIAAILALADRRSDWLTGQSGHVDRNEYVIQITLM